MNKKPTILAAVRHYLPGIKSGGPVRSISNMVNHLENEVEFRILTLDRDINDPDAYKFVKANEWQPVGKALVYYLPPQSCKISTLVKIIREEYYDILYLNGFFDSVFTIRVLLANKMGLLPNKPIVVAPRGDLVEGSFKIKAFKKRAYVLLAKAIGLYKNITWHATSNKEAKSIADRMHAESRSVFIAMNLPEYAKVTDADLDVPSELPGRSDTLLLVFLSRISREKNLDYALDILRHIKRNIRFDIYGPIEDKKLWEKCKKIINELPSNIEVRYRGIVPHALVKSVFAQYDIFFFPTSGENYGHVIAESFMAGTPVLTSDMTPWEHLEQVGLGWEVGLNTPYRYVEIIEKWHGSPQTERAKERIVIAEKAKRMLEDPLVLESNRSLFGSLVNDHGD